MSPYQNKISNLEYIIYGLACILMIAISLLVLHIVRTYPPPIQQKLEPSSFYWDGKPMVMVLTYGWDKVSRNNN